MPKKESKVSNVKETEFEENVDQTEGGNDKQVKENGAGEALREFGEALREIWGNVSRIWGSASRNKNIFNLSK